MSFLSEQIKQVGPIKISCWQRSAKKSDLIIQKNEISNALKEDNYVKSKVIRSAEEHISFRLQCEGSGRDEEGLCVCVMKLTNPRVEVQIKFTI